MDNNEKLNKSFCVGGATGIINSKGELVTTHIVITEEGSSVMGKPSGIYPVENTKQTSDYYLDKLDRSRTEIFCRKEVEEYGKLKSFESIVYEFENIEKHYIKLFENIKKSNLLESFYADLKELMKNRIDELYVDLEKENSNDE